MNLRTHVDDAASTIHIEGEISLFNAPLLRKEIERLKDDNRRLILDFSHVSYMDSTGIGVLVGAKKLLDKENLTFTLANVPESVSSLLETCSLHKFFDMQA